MKVLTFRFISTTPAVLKKFTPRTLIRSDDAVCWPRSGLHLERHGTFAYHETGGTAGRSPYAVAGCFAGKPPALSMPASSGILPRLRETLSAIVQGTPTRPQLHRFVADCTAIALTLVGSKIAAGSINTRHFGLQPSDIAFDAIADLFREDEDGNLVQIRVYFDSVDWEALEDEELLVQLRRLVFMRTNQGLFRMYNELDPALGKILRNTKLAIAALQTFVEMDHFGEPCIAPAMCDVLERLPMMDREYLERRVAEMTNGKERIPEILAKLSRYLRDQSEYSRLVPLLWVAYAVRSSYLRDEGSELFEPDAEAHLAEQDIRHILKEACARTRTANRATYATLENSLYESYFDVIEQILVKRLVTNDGHDVSLYKLLAARVPGLTRELYEGTHKAKLEYLARLAEKKAVEMLKKGFA